MDLELPPLMNLFQGFTRAYGTYKLDKAAVAGEKNVGKAATVKQPVTERLWKLHLSGIQGLGIIPINEHSMVMFGAIDIDNYNMNHEKLIEDIFKFKMPLVVCRTKSGGAHCYMFMREWTPAKLVKSKLSEMASVLGYGSSEIYPKQIEIIATRGDMGQWINMPYFDYQETTRFAYNANKKKLTLKDFIEFATTRRTSIDDLKTWTAKLPQELPEGPPCLQILCKQGFADGTRNNGLFNLGVYAMKSDPDNWEKKTADLNNKYMHPPLTPVEVMGVIKSLKKKEYNYTCNQQPIQPFCDSIKCRLCKFGIGQGAGLPTLGTLTKLETHPPTWFIDIETGGRIELTTEQLQNPRQFQLRCMEVLNVMPTLPTKQVWDALIQKLMEGVSLIEVSVDLKPEGQLLEAVEKFCTGRVQAKTQDEIILGKPWFNGNRHYFQVSALIAYLDRNRFKYESLKWVYKVLRDYRGTSDFFIIKSGDKRKGFNVWSMPEFVYKKESYALPDQGEEAPFA